MFEFRIIASALARRTKDSELDESTDLDIAQSSHALKVLREIAEEQPDAVLKALKLYKYQPITESSSSVHTRNPILKRKPKRAKKSNRTNRTNRTNRNRTNRTNRAQRRLLRGMTLSTAYFRRHQQ